MLLVSLACLLPPAVLLVSLACMQCPPLYSAAYLSYSYSAIAIYMYVN
jgi:hypothetical protein